MNTRTQLVQTVVVSALLGCGPGPVEEDETWMLGMFSHGAVPCDPSWMLYRYEVFEDGRFDIAFVEHGYAFNYRARWEQQGPGRIRVRRDDDIDDSEQHPISPGYAWDITRSRDCNSWGGYFLIRHPIERVNLETGARVAIAAMTPGALCMETNESVCFPPDAHIYWCDGPPPECNEDG